ncbi:MAG: hypothetical protein IT371_20490 [Deltaproteobacteria bacterium]|nr:hypothetical protein [Deltaproteobacteria bacterium]
MSRRHQPFVCIALVVALGTTGAHAAKSRGVANTSQILERYKRAEQRYVTAAEQAGARRWKVYEMIRTLESSLSGSFLPKSWQKAGEQVNAELEKLLSAIGAQPGSVKLDTATRREPVPLLGARLGWKWDVRPSGKAVKSWIAELTKLEEQVGSTAGALAAFTSATKAIPAQLDARFTARMAEVEKAASGRLTKKAAGVLYRRAVDLERRIAQLASEHDAVKGGEMSASGSMHRNGLFGVGEVNAHYSASGSSAFATKGPVPRKYYIRYTPTAGAEGDIRSAVEARAAVQAVYELSAILWALQKGAPEHPEYVAPFMDWMNHSEVRVSRVKDPSNLDSRWWKNDWEHLEAFSVHSPEGAIGALTSFGLASPAMKQAIKKVALGFR